MIALVLAGHVALSAIFNDHMVLQQRTGAPIWGTASAGGRVSISVAGRSIQTVADSHGRWRAELRDLRAGGPFTLRISGQNTIVVHDVMVGDVFLAAGQSNMARRIGDDPTNSARAANANDPKLRFFIVPRAGSTVPQTDEPGAAWASVSPRTVGDDSAVAYYFAKKIRAEKKIPVGVIVAAVGETSGEVWVSPHTMNAHPELLNYLGQQRDYARANGHEVLHYTPGAMFNGLVNPIAGYGIAGVLWYQGEGNLWPAGNARQYRALLALLIHDWRFYWNMPALPFYIVQLPNSGTPGNGTNLAELRESQLQVAQSVPNTGLAVTIDTGDPDPHPIDKWDVGDRLASLALRQPGAPLYSRMRVEGSRIRIWFADANEGLEAKGRLAGFEVAGRDGKFTAADAVIDGTTVVVSSAGVRAPVSARYGWSDNPPVSLYGKNGLPASPFTTSP